jgi:hypothetical protein
MYKEKAGDTQALRRVHDRRTRVLSKDMPNKREREIPSQNNSENEGEILLNLVPDPNAAIIAVILFHKKRFAGATQ